MKLIGTCGNDHLARVYIGDWGAGRKAEFVESLQPPHPRDEKWVLIVSSLFGCPVGCLMCDAGNAYQGKLTQKEILDQILFLVDRRYPDRRIPAAKFKIQFARMGEPAYNRAVLDVLRELPSLIDAPGLLPSLSTVAPAGCDDFFEELLEIKRKYYGNGKFQFQFSIHTSDQDERDRLIPIRKWSFQQMAAYGERFFETGDRKITLNFALSQAAPLDARLLKGAFHPDRFIVKITPLNPTYQAGINRLDSYLVDGNHRGGENRLERLRAEGFEVLISIGELEENRIGSNCGQYLQRHIGQEEKLPGGYSYSLESEGVCPGCK